MMSADVAKFYQLPKHLAMRIDLTVAAKLAFAVLKDRQGTNDKAWPTHGRIAKDMGVSRLTALRAVNELIRKKFILVKKRKGQSSEYRCQSDTCIKAIPVSELYRGCIKPIHPPVSDLDTELTHTTNPRTRPKKAAVKKQTAAYRQFTDYFTAEWKRLQAEHLDYPWAKGKDGVAAAAVWAACKEDLPRAKRVVDAYFASRDKFYIGHPLALMNMNLPKFMVKASGKTGTVQYNDAEEAAIQRQYDAKLKREAAT